MKKFKLIIVAVTFMLIASNCTDFLDIKPKQALDESLLVKASDMEGFVTAAYARPTDMPAIDSPFALWWWGSMRSDDSYKGGGGTWDVDGWHNMETFVSVTSGGWPIDYPWWLAYQVIGRCNTALDRLHAISEDEFKFKNARMGEMKFLRSYTYFNIRTFWKNVPYIDEFVVGGSDAFEKIPNRDDNMWEKILTDLKDAENLLPEVQPEKGRINKNAATAMIAKTLLFMAYEQDDRHKVVNINKDRLTEALVYLNKLTAQDGGVVGLCEDFGDNFDIAFDNNTKESIWETQYSIDDNSKTGGKINRGEGLNHPWEWNGFQCCGFHHLSYTLANAFKTGSDGLPMFDTYNTGSYADGDAVFFGQNTFDPRFSHTAAVPGQPFKYDPDMPFEKKAIRNAGDYGYLKSMKELVHPDCGCLLYDGWQFNSMNKKNIRYSEVLLWKAEVLIQLDRLNEAIEPINKVRERAAKSTIRLRKKDGASVLNYKCETYKPGVNCTWSKDFAWKAMQWEARLEMACEGRRFFDLQRWGILEKTMNDYFAVEKNRFSWMNVARFTSGRDEYLPIPQNQMNWAKGNYTQNPGY